ncbi:MAG: flavodoxin family protein [Oscillospiraceae bacterium]|nr:flavodoxin family protein [Oscillospiraceae bacterium]
MKTVLVLNSSPRANGNSETLTDSLIKGVQDAGSVGVKINLRELNILPCKGCFGCQSGHGDPCVQKDDMDRVYQAIREADVVVFASPVYWHQMNGIMRNTIDRLFAMMKTLGDKPRETALMVSAASQDPVVFDGLEANYKEIAGLLKWEVRGVIRAGGLNLPTDKAMNRYKNQALTLGRMLCQTY